ncbi:MAG: hypothetical protein KKI15_02450 [Proteobacteria bacterium]|nr:hypothetical protein [Pseudomonadota bacterium]
MTTFTSYGEVAYQRQGEIIRNLAAKPAASPQTNINELANAVVRKLTEAGVGI